MFKVTGGTYWMDENDVSGISSIQQSKRDQLPIAFHSRSDGLLYPERYLGPH